MSRGAWIPISKEEAGLLLPLLQMLDQPLPPPQLQRKSLLQRSPQPLPGDGLWEFKQRRQLLLQLPLEHLRRDLLPRNPLAFQVQKHRNLPPLLLLATMPFLLLLRHPKIITRKG